MIKLLLSQRMLATLLPPVDRTNLKYKKLNLNYYIGNGVYKYNGNEYELSSS